VERRVALVGRPLLQHPQELPAAAPGNPPQEHLQEHPVAAREAR